LLVQALLDAPMFVTRWRWNAAVGLALARFRGGCQGAARSCSACRPEDLLAAVFPDQVACGENLTGEREVPEHPLVAQTVSDCLNEAMDATGSSVCSGESSKAKSASPGAI
jgi:ATP-dependent Lhr-like helicase